MKKILVLITLLAGILPLPAQAQNHNNNVIDEIVWVVGNEAIWKSEVEEARMSALYENRKFERDPYCEIPEQLAVNKLFLHQAELDSIEVGESEVVRQVDYMMSEYTKRLGSREKMEEYFGKTSSQIRETLRESIREQITIQRMQEKIVEDVKVTPSQVRQFYSTLPQDSIPFIPTQVEVEIVTQEPKVPQAEIDDVRNRLLEYTDRVNKGESFTMLARLYSEDTGSALNGGDLGRFMGKGELDPAFATAAFSLQDPNKVSKIVESEFGYHIIQLVEKRGDRIRVRHILLRPHIPSEAFEAGKSRLDSIANDIRKGKFTFETAATYISQDKDTRKNYGLLPNEQTNSSKFKMDELPAEIAKVVENMQIGEISKAFTMINKKGKEICAIVKLKNRIDGHKATVADDFQSVKSMLESKRRSEVLEKWIREKQKHTYVRISDNWKTDCTYKYPNWGKN